MMILLIGCIGSGKSTWIKNNIDEKSLIINDDAIVNCFHADNYKLYNKNLKPLYKSIENLAISWGLNSGLDVIIDRPNLNVNTRRRYIELARSFDCENIIAVIFPLITPETSAKRRVSGDNRGRSYEYWLKAAQYQMDRYNEVRLSEGFSEICYV